MKTVYVNKKSELTAYMDAQQASGLDTYRTRTTCECMAPYNRRNGLLVLQNNILTLKVIRCKICTNNPQNHA